MQMQTLLQHKFRRNNNQKRDMGMKRMREAEVMAKILYIFRVLFCSFFLCLLLCVCVCVRQLKSDRVRIRQMMAFQASHYRDSCIFVDITFFCCYFLQCLQDPLSEHLIWLNRLSDSYLSSSHCHHIIMLFKRQNQVNSFYWLHCNEIVRKETKGMKM